MTEIRWVWENCLPQVGQSPQCGVSKLILFHNLALSMLF